MRNVNIFRTHVTDHIIPSEIMRRAIVLSPGKDWTDQKTEAYKYLKRWALEQDKRYPPKEKPTRDTSRFDDGSPIPMVYMFQTDIKNHIIPEDIAEHAKKLSPGKNWLTDHRTKAFKYIEKWALQQDKKHVKIKD